MAARKLRAKSLRWTVLALYVGMALFVGFFHTERTFEESKNCPACNFLKSALGVAPTVSYIPIILLFNEKLPSREIPFYDFHVIKDFVSRAPPLV